MSELKRRGEAVTLLLSDQRMPAISGVEFLEKSIELFPSAKRVLLTAYADTDAAIRAINAAKIHYYLTKPWDPPEIEQGERAHSFWILLEGGLRAEYADLDGTKRALANHHGSETFGEVPLLAGSPSKVECVINQPSRLLRLDEDSFWILMTTCPIVRKGILANMAIRMEGLQSMVMQREKLASLGIMAAGLMHGAEQSRGCSSPCHSATAREYDPFAGVELAELPHGSGN